MCSGVKKTCWVLGVPCVVSANFDHVVQKTAGCLQRGCKRHMDVCMHGAGDSWLFAYRVQEIDGCLLTWSRLQLTVCIQDVCVHGSGDTWWSAYIVQEITGCLQTG